MRPGLFVFLLLIASNVMAAKTPLIVGVWKDERMKPTGILIARPDGTAHNHVQKDGKWKATSKTGYDFIIIYQNGVAESLKINRDKKSLSYFYGGQTYTLVRDSYPPIEREVKKKPAKPVKKQPARQNKTDEADFGFKSLGARKAIRDYKATLVKEDKTKRKAMEEMEAEAKKAQKKYRVELIMNLEQALKKAMQDADLEEANKIRDAIKALKKGASPAGASVAGSKGKKKAKKSKARIPRDAVKWNGHHYMLSSERLTAQAALIKCSLLGGHLMRIESKQEHDFARKMVANIRNDAPWVDGTDGLREGEWRFSNGKLMPYRGWANGEPNGDTSINNIILWTGHGFFFADSPSRERHAFICEWDE